MHQNNQQFGGTLFNLNQIIGKQNQIQGNQGQIFQSNPQAQPKSFFGSNFAFQNQGVQPMGFMSGSTQSNFIKESNQKAFFPKTQQSNNQFSQSNDTQQNQFQSHNFNNQKNKFIEFAKKNGLNQSKKSFQNQDLDQDQMDKSNQNKSKKNKLFKKLLNQDQSPNIADNQQKQNHQNFINNNQDQQNKLDKSSKIKFIQKQKIPKFLQEQEPSNFVMNKKKNEQDDEQQEQDDANYDDEEDAEEEQEQPQSKKKTKKFACKYFILGTCTKTEEQCPFIHLQGIPIDEEQCSHYVVNKCNQGQKCSKIHDEEYKNQIEKIIQMAVLIRQNQEKASNQFQQNYKNHPSVENSLNSKNQKQVSSKELFNQKLNKINQIQINKEIEQEKDQKQQKTNQHGKKVLILNKIIEKNKNDQNSISEQGVKQQLSYNNLFTDVPVQNDFSDLYKQIKQQENLINDPRRVEKRLQEYFDKLMQMQSNPERYIINDRAMCLQMCSQSQIDDQYRDQSRFEKNRKGELFEQLAVKKLVRSAAGIDDMDDPKMVRPPSVLFLTVKYLRDCLVDQDLIPPGQSFYQYQNQNDISHKKFDIYAFMKDRTRQISQDISFYKNKIQNEETVGCFEQMIRYMVLSFHDGMSEPNFDSYSNMKQLTGFIGDLNEQYNYIKASKSLTAERKSFLLRNQAEIKSFHIICSADSHTEFQSVLKDVDCKILSRQDQFLINQAIKIAQSIQLEDFQRFFSLFKQTNYMFACLMLNFFQKMRSCALQIFRKSCFNNKNSMIDQNFLQKQLMFEEQYDYFNCLTKFGYKPEQNQQMINLHDRLNKDQWEVTIKKFRQIKISKLDDYRKQYLRYEIMEHGVHLNNGSLPQSQINKVFNSIQTQNKPFQSIGKIHSSQQQQVNPQIANQINSIQNQSFQKEQVLAAQKQAEEKKKKEILEIQKKKQNEMLIAKFQLFIKRYRKIQNLKVQREIKIVIDHLIKSKQKQKLKDAKKSLIKEQTQNSENFQKNIFSNKLQNLNKFMFIYEKFAKKWERFYLRQILKEWKSNALLKQKYEIQKLQNQSKKSVQNICKKDSKFKPQNYDFLNDLEIKNLQKFYQNQNLNFQQLIVKSLGNLNDCNPIQILTISQQDQQNFFMENLKNLLSSSYKLQFDWLSEKQGRKEIKNFGVSRIQFCIQHDDLIYEQKQGQGGNLYEKNKSQILMSFKDFQKFIVSLNKDSENFHCAQISLAVFIFYPQKVSLQTKSDFKKQIMDCTVQIQENGFLPTEKILFYEIENLPKISQENKLLAYKMMEQQITQQNFIEDMSNLKMANLSNAEFKIYSLTKIILYRCGEIKDFQIKNQNLQFFGEFNWYSRNFKQSLFQVQELLKDCSKNEYSQKSQKSQKLSTIQSLAFVKLLINGMPIISEEIQNECDLQQKHIQSLLCDLYVPLFIKNIQSQLPFLTQKHIEKFQEYFQIKFQEANLTGKEAFNIIYNGLLQIISAKSFEQNFKIKVAEQFVQQIVPYSQNEKDDLKMYDGFQEIDTSEAKQFLSQQFPNEFQNKQQVVQSESRIGKRNQPVSSDNCIDLEAFQNQKQNLKKRDKKAKQRK